MSGVGEVKNNESNEGFWKWMVQYIIPPLITAIIVVITMRADVSNLKETVVELKGIASKLNDSLNGIDKRLNRVEIMTDEDRSYHKTRGEGPVGDRLYDELYTPARKRK